MDAWRTRRANDFSPRAMSFWVLSGVLLFAGALQQSATAVAPAARRAVAVTDDSGLPVTVPQPPLRIVSLAPSATEMLFAAGAGQQVVATVDYSDEPPAARRVPRIGDVVAIDMERLVALRPDVVVVWPGGGNPAQIDKVARLGIAVYRQQVNALAELPNAVRRLGVLAGTGAVAEQEARSLEAHIARLTNEYARAKPPSVLVQVWNRPVYTVGGRQLISDVLSVCGARNIFGDLAEMAPVVDTEAVIARNPDVIVAAAPEGEAAAWLADWKRFGGMSAVRNGRLIAFEDQRLSRLGPSVLDAAAALCRRIAAASP